MTLLSRTGFVAFAISETVNDGLRLLRHQRPTPDTDEIFFRSCCRNPACPSAFSFRVRNCKEETMGRGILLWLLGVPIPVIILLWLFFGR
jgi:hypothetical protein